MHAPNQPLRVIAILLGLLITQSLVGVRPAAAVLVPSAPFEGSAVTLDTTTGLHWLTLTATLGESYDDVVAGAGGFTSAGWRHATLSEICALFEAYLVPVYPPEPCPGTFTSFPTIVTSSSMIELLGHLGVTNFSDPSLNASGSIGVAQSGGGPVSGVLVLTSVAGPFYAASSMPVEPDTQDPTLGHFLVADEPPGQVPVPVLGTGGSVMLAGLLAAAGGALRPSGGAPRNGASSHRLSS